MKFFSFTDIIPSPGTPWYIVASISAAAVVVVAMVIAGGICFLRVRRKNRQRDKGRVISQVEMKATEDLMPLNNSAHPVWVTLTKTVCVTCTSFVFNIVSSS